MVDKPKQEKKPSNNNKNVAAKAKAMRKAEKLAYFLGRPNHKRAGKKVRLTEKKTTLAERRNARKAKIIQAVNKKPSESLKKASKSNMKQAA